MDSERTKIQSAISEVKTPAVKKLSMSDMLQVAQDQSVKPELLINPSLVSQEEVNKSQESALSALDKVKKYDSDPEKIGAGIKDIVSPVFAEMAKMIKGNPKSPWVNKYSSIVDNAIVNDWIKPEDQNDAVKAREEAIKVKEEEMKAKEQEINNQVGDLLKQVEGKTDDYENVLELNGILSKLNSINTDVLSAEMKNKVDLTIKSAIERVNQKMDSMLIKIRQQENKNGFFTNLFGSKAA